MIKSKEDRPEGLQQPSSYIRELESLRGWAILLVVLFHYVGMLKPENLWPLNLSQTLIHLMSAGNTGVSLFFVLSGFLLARPFIQNIKSGTSINFTAFYRARALRILPLYTLVVLISWAATGNSACIKALFFIPIGFQAFPFSVPWWSLCTEIQFYLALPLIMWGLTRPAVRWWVLLFLIAWFSTHIYLLLNTNLFNMMSPLTNSLIDRGCAFFAGALAAWLSLSKPSWLAKSRGLSSDIVLCMALCALVAILLWYGKVDQFQAMIRQPLFHYFEATLWAIILYCLIQPKSILKPVFCNAPFDFLGRISYSLYLLHVPLIFYIVFPFLHSSKKTTKLFDFELSIAVIASAFASVVLSSICYRFIEAPFLRLKTKTHG